MNISLSIYIYIVLTLLQRKESGEKNKYPIWISVVSFLEMIAQQVIKANGLFVRTGEVNIYVCVWERERERGKEEWEMREREGERREIRSKLSISECFCVNFISAVHKIKRESKRGILDNFDLAHFLAAHFATIWYFNCKTSYLYFNFFKPFSLYSINL